MDKKIIIGGNVFGYSCDFKESKEIIFSALDNGINQVDTADVYSKGLSEKIIGKIIKNNKLRNKIKIFTKVGTNGLKFDKCNSKSNIEKKVNDSLKRLQTSYIDLYQLHNFDPVTPLSESFETLSRLKKIGKIKDFGISNFFKKELLKIPCKKKLFNQLNMNILNIKNYELKDECKIIAYGVLARGVFSENYFKKKLSFRKKNSDSIKFDLKNKLLRKHIFSLHKFSRRNSIKIEELAFNYVYNLTGIKKMIIGFSDKKYIENLLLVKNKKINFKDIKNIQRKFYQEVGFKNKLLGKFL